MDYKQAYKQLDTTKGRIELTENPNNLKALEEKMDNFMKEYKEWKAQVKPEKNNIFELPLKTILDNTVKTMVDIIGDVYKIYMGRNEMSASTLRKALVQTFMRKDRQMYVGIWIVIGAFILYFLDSTI